MAHEEKDSREEMLVGMYDRLRRLATKHMAKEALGQTLQATALVHEAWLRLTKNNEQEWRGQGHFYAAASETMRRILIDNARRKNRLCRGGSGQQRLSLEDINSVIDTTAEEKVLLIDEALQRLQGINHERAQVVTLKFFGGLTSKEIARTLEISERSVDRHWACAKLWLYQWIAQGQ